MKYDPMVGPDPEAWLELDEGERIDAVLRFHKRKKLRSGSLRAHAVIHTVVETQLASENASAGSALERLQQGRLDRHDAIHAIGSVLAGQLYGALRGEQTLDPTAYDEALASLTAASWHGSD